MATFMVNATPVWKKFNILVEAENEEQAEQKAREYHDVDKGRIYTTEELCFLALGALVNLKYEVRPVHHRIVLRHK